MTGQMFWVMFAIFVLGLFVGSNLGIMLLCVLRVAGQHADRDFEMAAVPVTNRSE